ncbi:hypothetical protein Tco_0650590 [Tanacetum coccineum]
MFYSYAASLDYRIKSPSPIKEFAVLWSFVHCRLLLVQRGREDRDSFPILESSQRPIIIEKFCFDCGDLVRGLYCRECALIRKTLEEVFQNLQDTSELSDNNTNVVNAPREPIVVKQDPDSNIASPKSCGKGAHYGYNCPPKVPFISNPELPNK